MTEAEAIFTLEQGVATLTLNRPAALNAMTESMVEQIIAGVAQATADGATVLLVRAGEVVERQVGVPKRGRLDDTVARLLQS